MKTYLLNCLLMKKKQKENADIDNFVQQLIKKY
jgi:hypothetical protein